MLFVISWHLLLLFAASVSGRPQGLLEEWPSSPLRPYDIAILSDSSVWLTHVQASSDGVLNDVPIVFTVDPSDGSVKRCDEPFDGPARYETLDRTADDTLWIADSLNNRIVHFDPSECADPATANPQADAFDASPLPPLGDDPELPACGPYGVSVDGEGSVWIACTAPYIIRYDPDGETPDVFQLATDDNPTPGPARDIAFAPDGTVWFTMTGHPHYGGIAGLGRLDPRTEDGNIAAWTDPDDFPADCFSYGSPYTFHGISFHDGILWFLDHTNSSLLRYDPIADSFECYPLPRVEESDGLWDAHYFVQDRDGVFWMAAFGQSLIGTFTPDTGTFDTLSLTAGAAPMGISLSPDGEIWWAESFAPGRGGVGRFRPTSTLLSLVEPTEAEPAAAGTPTDGDRVFVRLIAAGDLDRSLDNLIIEVDGEALVADEGEIALHSLIESEIWLVIRPGARDVDCYDLTVRLRDTPEIAVTAYRSLCYRDAEVPRVDRVVAIDRTNSMNYDSISRLRTEEKMNAARAAGQFFVDLSNDQDGIGVVSFQRTDENGNGIIDEDELSEAVAPLASIVDAAQRQDLRERIRDITPGPGGGRETSLGAGLLEARAMLEGHEDRGKVIVLVTDGRENLPPFWSQDSIEWYEGSGPTLEGEFEGGSIRIDTVSIGLDAENAVLVDMSRSTRGTMRNELEGPGSFGLLSRLASSFKAIDEDNRLSQDERTLAIDARAHRGFSDDRDHRRLRLVIGLILRDRLLLVAAERLRRGYCRRSDRLLHQSRSMRPVDGLKPASRRGGSRCEGSCAHGVV